MSDEAKETKDTSKDSIQAAIEATMPMFGGHPAIGGEEEDIGPDETDKEETPPVEAPDKEDDWRPKYKNQQEAEKAYKSAERAMHDAKQEAKDAREEAARVKKELEETRAAQRSGEATRNDVKQAEKKVDEAETRKTVAQNVKNALVKMNKLDTDDPDYYDKVGELWAEAGFGGAGVDTKDIEALVDKKVLEMMGQKDAEEAKAKEAKVGVKKANEAAAQAGLEMKEGSPDHRLFWMLAQQAPQNLDFEGQVEWAIAEVNTMKEGLTGKKQSQKADAFREEYSILEKGGSAPPARRVADIKPMSIGDALEATQRRI